MTAYSDPLDHLLQRITISEPVHFTLWSGRTASSGGYGEMSWADFLTFLNSPVVADDKNALEGWSPAKFKANRRGKANVEAVSCLVLDDDSTNLSPIEIEAIWHRFAGAVHTSHSHTPLDSKWRIVLRLSRDVNAEEHAILWEHARDWAAKHGQAIDEATKDASRLWYVPATTEERKKDYSWCELKGSPIDVDQILASCGAPDGESRVVTSDGLPSERNISVAEPGRSIASGQGAGPDARRRAMAAALGSAWPPRGAGRHEAQLALAGALRSEGWAEAEALEFLCDVTRAAGDEDREKRKATIRHTYDQPAGAPLTGWTRLKAKVDPVTVDAVRGALGRDADLEERIRLVNEAKAEPLIVPAVAAAAPKWLTPAQRALNVGGRDIVRLQTGFRSLDAATRGGLLLRKVIAVGGAPGAGKTALAVRLAFGWLGQGVHVSFLAADEDADAILIRFGQLAGISRDALENGESAARETLSKWCESVPFHLIDGDEDGVTIEAVSADLRAIAGNRPSVLVGDSMQTLRSAAVVPKGADARTRINEVVRALKRSAKVDGHLVVATSEISKAAYRNADQADAMNPLAAFKESGDIEYGVGLALVLRNRVGTSELVEGIVAKNRLGPGKPAFLLKLDHVRADIEETSESSLEGIDPLYFIKLDILKIVEERAGVEMAKTQIYERVGGDRNRAAKALRQLLDEKRIHQTSRGIRILIPGDPGYGEKQ